MSSDRRKYPRFPAAWPVEISVEQYSLVGRAVDVSEYGICVAAAPSASLRVGDCYRVEVLAGNGTRLSGTGEVRYITDDRFGLMMHERLPME